MDLDSHAYTIVCSSNCIIIHFMGKECDVVPYTDAYERINSVPIFQSAKAYDNPKTGETTIQILNEAIWMGETIYHTLVNPNQLCSYGMTFQDNPFVEYPNFIATEDHEFMLPLSSKGSILGVTTRTPMNKELHICPNVTCLLAHEWDPQNVSFLKSSHTLEEDISSNIGAVMKKGGYLDLTDTDSDSNSVDQTYDIGAMKSQMIGIFKVAFIPSSNVYEKNLLYKMYHRPVNSSQRDAIQPCHLKN